MNLETYLKVANLTIEEMREQYLPKAIETTKTELVLEAIAKAEQFPISEEDIEDHIAKIAESYWQPVEKIREAIEQSDSMDGIKQSISLYKAEDYIFDNAVINEEIVFENTEKTKEEKPAKKEKKPRAKKAKEDEAPAEETPEA